MNRVNGTFVAYSDGSDDPWGITSADHVLEQAIPTYDAASNVIQNVAYQRNQGATSATEMLTADNSRVTYTGMWYDGVARTIAVANYGTTLFTPSAVTSPPASSPDVLVNLIAYNDRGVKRSRPPILPGSSSHTDSDDAGRLIRTIQNYQPGESAGSDANITVEKTYTRPIATSPR